MLQIVGNTGRRSATCLCVVCKKTYEVDDRFTAGKVHAGDQCDSCKYLLHTTPTQAMLLQAYNYDPDTGELTYKRDFSRRKKGEDATTAHNGGYRMLTLDKSYLAHRVIWLMQTGEFPKKIDHINHDRSDNRWLNLRNATDQLNMTNRTRNSNNSSGFVGVSYMKAKDKYRAYLTVDRQHIHLGLFNSAEEAYQARLTESAKYSFHENHGRE